MSEIEEDGVVRLITQSELLANASDIDGDGLVAAGLIITSGSGTLTDNGDGSWSYMLVPEDDTDVSFAYIVTDASDNVAGIATLDIAAVNDTPSTTEVSLAAIAEDSGIRLITQAELLANATDIEGDELEASGLVVTSGNGMLADNGDGTWSYTPAANDDTDVSFSYAVTDITENIAGSAVLDITPVNDSPEGGDSSVQTPEDTPYVLTISDFPFSDLLDGDEFSGIFVTSLPAGGVLSLSGEPVMVTDFIDAGLIEDGALVFTPSLNHVNNGSDDTLRYLLRDSGGTSNGGLDTGTEIHHLTFVVNAVNDSPEIITRVVAVDEGADILINSEHLSGFDVDDLSPQDLTYTLESQPDNGVVILAGNTLSVGDTFTLAELINNQLRYVHDGSETSFDFVDLSLADGGEDGALAASGRLSFIIREVIDPVPVIESDQFTLRPGGTFSSEEGDTLASGFATLGADLLQENSGFAIAIEMHPEHGVIEFDQNGNFTYVHNNSAVLQDEFTYRITNEDGVSTLATVRISIEPPVGAVFGGFSTVEVPDADTEAAPSENVDTMEQQIEDSVDEFVPDSVGTPTAEVRADNQQIRTVVDLPVQFQEIEESRVEFVFNPIGVNQHSSVKKSDIKSVDLTVDNSYLEFVINDNFDGLARSGSFEVKTRPQLAFDEVQSETELSDNIIGANDVVFGVSVSATAGFVAWALRGGALVASVMAATPLWASIDPVRILNNDYKSNKSDEVEDLFDNGNTPK